MESRYRRLGLYSLLLAAAAAGWLGAALRAEPGFPPAWAVLLAIGACLFVWQFGLPAPRVGLASMERLPQIGLLLVLPPAVAAAICAAASLLWPLLNRSYSQGSLKLALVRAVHNPAMTALMLLAAGYVYQALGGRHPLDGLGPRDVLPLLAMALTAQGVNVALLALFYRLDGRDVRRVIRPIYSALDLLFVPAGVLAAVLYNTASASTFGLFVGLMAVFVLSFNGLGRALGTPEREGVPLVTRTPRHCALRGARRVDELAEHILTEARALFRFDEACLALVDRERRELDVRIHERAGERLPVRAERLDAGLFGWVAAHATPVLIEDWQRAPGALARYATPADRQFGSLMAVPLVESGTVVGLLGIRHLRPRVYGDADLHLMQGLAADAAAALADARAFEELEGYRRALEERVAERTRALEQANLEKERLIDALGERSRALERESQEDPLTGIANRRCFGQRLTAEIEVALAVGQPLTLAVADLDHFKAINDRLGHAVGDEVLRHCAALLRRLCAPTDLVARIGGEEFALILPGRTHAEAVRFCESVRQAVESHSWRTVHPRLAVTVSIGIAEWDGAADAAQLLGSADTQLYHAKHMGRNRVAS